MNGVNTQPHNSTAPAYVRPSAKKAQVSPWVVTKAFHEKAVEEARAEGYEAGRRDAAKAAHPSALHKPTHGGYCG